MQVLGQLVQTILKSSRYGIQTTHTGNAHYIAWEISIMHHPEWKRIGVCAVTETAMHCSGSMKMRTMTIALAMGLWLLGLSLTPSAMAVSLDFNISAPTSGTVAYGGSDGALTGTSIEVDNVVGLSTPANPNVTSICLSCVLNFTTGTLAGAGGPGGSNNGWWSFGSGGTITITGGVQLQGGTDIPSGATLLTGSFNSAFVQDLGLQGFRVTFGTFFDTKHPDLLSYYGLSTGTPFGGSFTLLFESPKPGVGGAFTSTSIFSGSVVNTVAIAAVPVPAAVFLFGSGLAGLCAMVRKQFRLV